jgi:hypothetical protein
MNRPELPKQRLRILLGAQRSEEDFVRSFTIMSKKDHPDIFPDQASP